VSGTQVRLTALGMVLASCVGARAGEFRGRIVVEDFEGFVWGEDWATVQFSPGADPRMGIERENPHSGKQACRLDVPPGESLTLVTQHGTSFLDKGDKPPLPLPGVPERVGLWVRGAKSGHTLWVRLVDAAGKAADVALGSVGFEGWKLLEASVPHLTAPLGLGGVLVRGGQGPLVIDDLTVLTTVNEPLYLRVRPASPEEDFLEGRWARFRVTIQSVAEKEISGKAELLAFRQDGTERGTGTFWAKPPSGLSGKTHLSPFRSRFSFRVSAGEPFSTPARLSLEPGVYIVVATSGSLVADGASEPLAPTTSSLQAVVYAKHRVPAAGGARAVSRFASRRDALRVYETGLSPGVIVEATGTKLTLFRGLPVVGLGAPRDGLMEVRSAPKSPTGLALTEPWIVVWFGAAPEWSRVTFADGSPCPTFDVPLLVVTESAPESWKLEDGLELTFPRRGARVVVMPLHGIRGVDPSLTTPWDKPERVAQLKGICRFWARVLRAMPIDVEEEWRIDRERDEVEVRARFRYLELRGPWREAPRRVAPVPPLLMLARQAGLAIRFSREPIATGCFTSVGPYCVVPDVEEYTYTVSGLLRFLYSAVADVPPGVPGSQVTLARDCRSLSDAAAKIPFWTTYAGKAGRLGSDALLRFMLSRANARYAYDAEGGRVLAWDGLAGSGHVAASGPLAASATSGPLVATAAGEWLRGCWHAGLYAGLWEPMAQRWRHITAFREAVADGDWATLGLGARACPVDARVNAELFFARLAARLGGPDAHAEGCVQAVKLLAAAYALAAAAPAYREAISDFRFGGPVGQRMPFSGSAPRNPQSAISNLQSPVVFGGCRPGSVGFVPGPAPFVTAPSDAGYGFAGEFLGEYFRERFRSGPLDFYGRNPAEWSARLFVRLGAPEVGKRFRPAPRLSGPYATNYVFTVEPGPDGWPALAWHSHRSPAGGPLLFGSMGTERDTKGKLERTVTVTPWLRLSAYSAIEAPPPPKEPESPELPPP